MIIRFLIIIVIFIIFRNWEGILKVETELIGPEYLKELILIVIINKIWHKELLLKKISKIQMITNKLRIINNRIDKLNYSKEIMIKITNKIETTNKEINKQ